MPRFATIEGLQRFMRGPMPAHAHGHGGTIGFRNAVIEYLATGGFDTSRARPMDDAQLAGATAVSLLLYALDSERGYWAYAIPDTLIDMTLRQGLEGLSRSRFELHFFNDLPVEQWPTALRILALMADYPEDIEENLDTYFDAFRSAGVDVPDAAELLASIGAWCVYGVDSGAELNLRVTHLYAIWQAM